MAAAAKRTRAIAFIGIVLALACTLVTPALPAWAASPNLAAGSSMPGQQVTVGTQNRIYQAASAKDEQYVDASGITSGSATYDPSTKTLTLENVKGKKNSNVSVWLEGQAIKINLVGSNSFGDLLLNNTSSATITGKGSYSGNIYAYEGSFEQTSGTVNGTLYIYKGSAAITGGTTNGTIYCNTGTFTMSGGKLTRAKGQDGIVNATSMVMKGGSIISKNGEYGIVLKSEEGKQCDFTMSGGTVGITGTTNSGLAISGGNLVMTGGTLKVTGCHAPTAILAERWMGNRKSHYGGAIRIKGGKLYATLSDPEQNAAIDAYIMTNKPASLKAIAGSLPKGAHFISGGNEYEVGTGNYVALVKYNSAKKTPKIFGVTYGKSAYQITKIGPKAFSTKNGRKITALTVESHKLSIGKNALYGTSALRTLTFTGSWWKENYNAKRTALKSVTIRKGSSIAKKAFAKCGKSGGKGLTVAFGGSTPKASASKYRALLTSHGMSKAVKIKTR